MSSLHSTLMATGKYQRYPKELKCNVTHNWQYLVPSLKAELRAALGSVLGLGSHSEQDTLLDLVMKEAGDKDGDQELTVEEINTA